MGTVVGSGGRGPASRISLLFGLRVVAVVSLQRGIRILQIEFTGGIIMRGRYNFALQDRR